jgi:hypothetical protein
MATEIPEELKLGLPKNLWGKLLMTTPIVMTVIATLLAGLASSEMTKAQYDRAYAAQLQSKAGDQWSYFQAKKLRGAMQRNSLELLQATLDIHPLSPAVLAKADPRAAAALERNELPAVTESSMDDRVKAAVKALENFQTEPEIAALLKGVGPEPVASALQSAKRAAIAFDVATKSLTKTVDEIQKSLSEDKSLAHDFAAAKMGFNAARYEAEARLNQSVANLVELQVRQNNVSAERHQARSGWFFLGMLSAQAAVIVSTFAMAARQRNLLWTLAAIAGLAAVVFAIYVYLRV